VKRFTCFAQLQTVLGDPITSWFLSPYACDSIATTHRAGAKGTIHTAASRPGTNSIFPAGTLKKNLSSRPGSHFMRMPLPLTKIDSLLDTMTWSSPVYSKKILVCKVV
jgi:hypothetical protein